MPKAMNMKDKLPSKYDKYSAKNGQVDVIVVLKSKLPDDNDPTVMHEDFYWQLEIIDGNRQTPNGEQYWSVVAHPDPNQNYAEQYGQRKTKVAALALKLGHYNTEYSQFHVDIQCLPWVFTGPRWERIRTLGNAAKGGELAIICLGREMYQENTQIDPLIAEERKVMQRMLANPTYKQAIQAAILKGQKLLQDAMKPNTREEQIAAVTGQRNNQAGGGAPASNLPAMGGASDPNAGLVGGISGQTPIGTAEMPPMGTTQPAGNAGQDLDALFGNGGGEQAAPADPLAGAQTQANDPLAGQVQVETTPANPTEPDAADTQDDILGDFLG